METFGIATVSTPIGELVVVSSEEGLARVAFAAVEEVRGEQYRAWGGGSAAEQIGEYFAGERREFDLALDWRHARGFYGSVQRALCDVGFGETVSYAELAARVGRPKAVRAAGTACALNPLPIVVPCHRVLRSDGSLGGYRGGTQAKEFLLELEAGENETGTRRRVLQ
ncbi:methylated-DNA--[protein]-cysteine S-methyltransferase [Corynebacterium liangguodongii]|uniref:methylated-DNA--[protein]-cysteine S-methyltransferase n=1 Tax=Corynebacterium liangguodongii TaxID=2079535 RepID=UPI001F3647AD|nr:methylated-DNA--[protein]-cysteine S-methyltransferase [Corynebacterium liangguodongii]